MNSHLFVTKLFYSCHQIKEGQCAFLAYLTETMGYRMKNFSKKCGLAVLSTLVVSSLHAAVVPDTQKNSSWFNEGQAAIQKQLALTPKNRAKNVILFVGDGLGVSTITAGRIFAGQKLGISGEEHQLSFDRCPIAPKSKLTIRISKLQTQQAP